MRRWCVSNNSVHAVNIWDRVFSLVLNSVDDVTSIADDVTMTIQLWREHVKSDI